MKKIIFSLAFISVTSLLGNTAEDVEQKVSDTAHKSVKVAKECKDKAKDFGTKAKNKIVEGAEAVKGKVKDAAEYVKNTSKRAGCAICPQEETPITRCETCGKVIAQTEETENAENNADVNTEENADVNSQNNPEEVTQDATENVDSLHPNVDNTSVTDEQTTNDEVNEVKCGCSKPKPRPQTPA